MTLKADYRESDMRLVSRVTGLQQQGFSILAGMVAMFVLAAPTILMGALLYVLLPLLDGRRLRGPVIFAGLWTRSGAGTWWRSTCWGCWSAC